MFVAGFDEDLNSNIDLAIDLESDILVIKEAPESIRLEEELTEILRKLAAYNEALSGLVTAEGVAHKKIYMNKVSQSAEEIDLIVKHAIQKVGAIDEEAREANIEALRRSRGIISTVSLISIVIIAFTLYFIVQMLSRPVEDLLAGIEGIAVGEYNHKVEVHYKSELSRVADALNDMSDALEERDQEITAINEELHAQNEELADMNDHLEGAVTEKTQELFDKNEQLELKNAEIIETSRLKSQFLANMSHELRTPLNSIIGFSTVLIDGLDGDLSDQQKESANFIRKSGTHLLSLINDILDYSRIEAGKMKLEFERIDLAGLLSEQLNSARGLIGVKEIELKLDIKDGLPGISADRMRITQVIINLLSNAVKFTEKGIISINAKLTEGTSGSPETGFVSVSVSDTGIGIDEKYLSLIFDDFRQVDGSTVREHEGSGLGLAISRKIVAMHGGELTVESEFGKGSVFTFTLPIEGA
jgi:signal transduction histidine kinase